MWWLFIAIANATVFDFCILGDSTLQMFVVPTWRKICTDSSHPCHFSVRREGVYHEQLYKGRVYPRKTLFGQTRDNCSFMMADFHEFEWNNHLKTFWQNHTLADRIVCRRVLTNFHHHATLFLTRPRTIDSIVEFGATLLQRLRDITAFDTFVYLLPTIPRQEGFAQTKLGVIETSVVMSARYETIATLQLLSSVWLQRGNYHDNLHIDTSLVAKDNFTIHTMIDMLMREYEICRKRHVQ